MFHFVMFDIMVDTACLHRNNQKHIGKRNHEMFLAQDEVHMRGMWVLVNKDIRDNDPRVWDWAPSNEFGPHGMTDAQHVSAVNRVRPLRKW